MQLVKAPGQGEHMIRTEVRTEDDYIDRPTQAPSEDVGGCAVSSGDFQELHVVGGAQGAEEPALELR